MRTVADILRTYGLPPPPKPGTDRYYSTCPKCSGTRKKAKAECLGITIDADGVSFGCNHCGWTGGEFFNGKDTDPVVVIFDYVDETGALLFRKLKTAAKNFWQERPDGGGWIKNLDGVRKVLYRLPELLEDLGAERTITITEGEKDSDNLRKIGVPATTNTEGAKQPGQRQVWLSEYSEALRGADVVLMPDHDPPGYARVDFIAKQLTGIAKRVRVLALAEHWPGCPENGDVSKWLEAGGTREQLDALLDDAKPWTENSTPPPGEKLFLSTTEFVVGFQPPDYLIDGLIQRRFLYSMTAPTGSGKTAIACRLAAHVDQGLPFAGREVERGKVLFFAGENPDDVRMRTIKLLEEMKIEPDACGIVWHAGSLKLSDQELRKRIAAETKERGPFALVVVDTSAAFFEGEEENSNAQMGAHARMLRSLIDLSSGGPTVIVTCHPTKNAQMDNLLPRGGGAFIAEVDGNFVCIKQPDSHIVELHWHGKFRGPDFAPIPFKLTVGKSAQLVDSKGRAISTVTARPIDQYEVEEDNIAARSRQDRLLFALCDDPGASLAELGKKVGWFYSNGEPNKSLVNRTLKALQAARLIKKEGHGWVVTPSGLKLKKAVPR